MKDTYVIGEKMARNGCSKTAIYTVTNFGDQSLLRACVARGAWHPWNFRTSHLAPTYFEILSKGGFKSEETGGFLLFQNIDYKSLS